MVNLKFLTRNVTANNRKAQDKEMASSTFEPVNVGHGSELVMQKPIPNWSDFFGIDLKNSPNKEWYELSNEKTQVAKQ